jgi:hypothetical protein
MFEEVTYRSDRLMEDANNVDHVSNELVVDPVLLDLQPSAAGQKLVARDTHVRIPGQRVQRMFDAVCVCNRLFFAPLLQAVIQEFEKIELGWL